MLCVGFGVIKQLKPAEECALKSELKTMVSKTKLESPDRSSQNESMWVAKRSIKTIVIDFQDERTKNSREMSSNI